MTAKAPHAPGAGLLRFLLLMLLMGQAWQALPSSSPGPLLLPCPRLLSAVTDARAASQDPGAPALLETSAWDSLAAISSLVPASGAILEDTQEVEIYLQNGRFWAERRLTRTLGVEDPQTWPEETWAPEIWLKPAAQIRKLEITLLPPSGKSTLVEDPSWSRLPADPCLEEAELLQIDFPPVDPHTLVRWELILREPTATARVAHWFGAEQPVLDSTFFLQFPKAFLDTDWAQHIRSHGTVPEAEMEDRVGRLKGLRTYRYAARDLPGHPRSPHAPPLSWRIPHILLLPGYGEPGPDNQILLLLNRMEKASVLSPAERVELLSDIESLPLDRRIGALHEKVADLVRIAPVPLEPLEFLVQTADETLDKGCGTAADAAVLLTAGLRELGFASRPVLIRSRAAGPDDETFTDPQELDAVLVRVALGEGSGGQEAAGGADSPAKSSATESFLWLDPACPECGLGYIPWSLQDRPGATLELGNTQWIRTPSFGAHTNWLSRTADLRIETDPSTGRPVLTGTVQRASFGEIALRERRMLRDNRDAGVSPASETAGDRIRETAVSADPEPAALNPPVEDASRPLESAARQSLSDRRLMSVVDLRGLLDREGPLRQEGSLRAGSLSLGEDSSPVLAEGIFSHEMLPEPGTPIDQGILLEFPFVVQDSVIVTLPEGWTAGALPEPTMVQGPGFHFTTRTLLDGNHLVHTTRLVVQETLFQTASARSLLDLAAAIKEKDSRKIRLVRAD